jgi:membrane fusion protein (multidrug efflux system)
MPATTTNRKREEEPPDAGEPQQNTSQQNTSQRDTPQRDTPHPDTHQRDADHDDAPRDDGRAASEKDRKTPERDGGKPAPPAKPPFYKRPLLMMGIVCGVMVVAIVAVVLWLYLRQYQSTDDAFIQGHVTPISPKVAALVSEVKVDDNNYVHTGQVLVQLDDRDFKNALKTSVANEAAMLGELTQAKSNLEVANAGVEEAQAELTVAQVNFENADRNFKRYQALDARATSREQLDNVSAEERGNAAQVKQAQAKVAQMQAQVAAAASQIQIAQGNYDRAVSDRQQAELNLSYCTIVSPQDGYITRKSVEPGSYVTVGQSLFSTVPKDVWIIANFKETQLDLMRPGQPVEVHVDAYPDKTFHGKVDSIQAGTGAQFSLLPPENATGNYVKVVQRVPVKIVFDPGETDDPNHILGVGLSVEPSVKVR